MSHFAAEVFQNEFLALGASEVNAIVTVTALQDASDLGTAARAAGPERAAEIVIVDTSGSMLFPSTKLRAALHATAAAVDAIRDGVLFGVIAGTDTARMVFPATGPLVPASPATRAQAKAALADVSATGGTAMGSWLRLARDRFDETSALLRHTILLTDGQNQHESHEELGRVLASCEGRFQCDCRGVGTDWEVAELRRIASALLGTVDIVAEPADLEADFLAMTANAMDRRTADVRLRLWMPDGASVVFFKQVSPAIEDLTARALPVAERTVEYPTGAWGADSRDYHLCIRVRAREAGDEVLAGRVALVVDREVITQALVRAVWTDDERLSTRISREVAHYTGQAELAEAIQEGLEARRAGDEETATYQLGRAVRLAAVAGNDATMQLLRGVVEIDDPATGTVRLRGRVEEADEMSLDTRSTKTIRVQRTAT